MADLDPIDPTEIAPGVAAVPLIPTPWDDMTDGQHALSGDGTVWQRRGGLWHMAPWWQDEAADEIKAICADPDEWAYDVGWTRKQVEDAKGPLTPITLPSTYPHDDARCRQDSVDAAGFREVCRALARIGMAAGLTDGVGAHEIADAVCALIEKEGRSDG